MNSFIIFQRPTPDVQDSLILNSRCAGMLNNPNVFLTVCVGLRGSVAIYPGDLRNLRPKFVFLSCF
jgi:hypothetical protein